MRTALVPILACLATADISAAIAAAASLGAKEQMAIHAPQNRPYPGVVHVSVNATDVERRIVHVKETITGMGAAPVLLYPEWLPGKHAPEGSIDRLAGLWITANGTPLSWTRDTLDMYAFHVKKPQGVTALDVEFDYLSPTSPKVGKEEWTHEILTLEWSALVLYPAGYFAGQIPVEADVRLPEGWRFATALKLKPGADGNSLFERVSLETLVDSPIYAGRYCANFDLDPGGAVPVHMTVFADSQESLVAEGPQIAAHRALVEQAYKLFGSRHYVHYDFLLYLSDQLPVRGLEHLQSSENGTDSGFFSQWKKSIGIRELLPHEYVHSWNGKFRRPQDLWTPNYNVQMQNSLLWVYEGQTTYWGYVLTARSGLWSKQEALDELAEVVAYAQVTAGRSWRPLQDTTNDQIINPRRPQAWRSWQRFEDYYREGELLWLDVDAVMRDRSHGQRSLDDFAKSFFAVRGGEGKTVTYTFDDVVRSLEAIVPYDWSGFFRGRLNKVASTEPLDALQRSGYQLIFTETPSDNLKALDDTRKSTSLVYSIGLEIDEKEGMIANVLWGSPSFRAGLKEGTRIVAVNGIVYSPEVLKDAIKAANGSAAPIELIVKVGDRVRIVQLDYHGGLRYPHLERTSVSASLDDILAPRPH